MKSYIIFLLFVGMFLIMHGIYEEKLQNEKKSTRVEYRFIPKTYYDAAFEENEVSSSFKNMFQKDDPYIYSRN